MMRPVKGGARMSATNLAVDDDHAWSIDQLVGRSPAASQLRETVMRLARDPAAPVHFVGETGTGRSHAARLVHHLSEHGKRPFVRVACASSTDCSIGEMRWSSAGGTLYLYGAHLAPESLRASVCQFIESQSLADTDGQPRSAGIRILASSDSRTDRGLESGSSILELCSRTRAEIVRIPPLRDRAEDIDPLVRHFTRSFAAELGKHVERVSNEVLEALEQYSWPGNVRELRAVIERAVLLADGELLHLADFAPAVTNRHSGAEMDLPPSGVNLERLERNLVIQALQRTGGNQTRAATLLGLNRDQVRYRIEKFGLPRA
jgi:two-component system, NtrC family, response regulator AtoC